MRVGADERALDEAQRRRFVRHPGGPGGEGHVEVVQQGHRAQHMALVRREVAEGAADQGREVDVEVGGAGLAPGAPDRQEPLDGEVEVEREAVRACGDDRADLGCDDGGAVAHEPAGQVVVAVLGGEVADEDLPARGRSRRGGVRRRPAGDGQAWPCRGPGPVELAVQRVLGPLQPAASGDDEERVGHEPYDALEKSFQVAVDAVADVLEGVQQDHRQDRPARGQPRELPGEQVRVVGEGVQVGLGLQQVGQPGAARERPYGGAVVPQCADDAAGDLPDDRADRARQQHRLGDVGQRRLHLLRHGLAEAPAEAAAAQELLQRLAGVDVVPVAAQRQVEGGQRAAELGEGEPDGEDHALEVGARRTGEVDPHRQDAPGHPDGFAPLGGPVLAVGEGGLHLPGQGRLPYAADAVEHENVVTRRLQVFHVEAGCGHCPHMLGEGVGDGLPLLLTVGEVLLDLDSPIIRTEQRTKIPSAHRHSPRVYPDFMCGQPSTP